MRPKYIIMNGLKVKFLIIVILATLMYLHVLYKYVTKIPQHQNDISVTSVVLPYVVVHIDLKKMPPKLSYLESLLPVLKNNGANGLLMEYEDMFPYEGKLVNLSRKDCYDKSELQKFVSRAVKLGFEIIPLVQTFGHMEYALKLEEYQHLREVVDYPDSICPSKRESLALIKEMLKQIILFHGRIFQMNYIHVGCDEVYQINKCVDCRNKNATNIDIFVKHVGMVTRTVKQYSPSTTVLIWDDMLRKKEFHKQRKSHYFVDVNPVCWDYKTKVTLSNLNLLLYHRQFNNIWIASAFKGADSRTATFPNVKYRFMNHLSWMNTIAGYKFGGEDNVYNFKGIILTGWSSYSHMDPPCELLPVSIHSLILNLYLIKKYKNHVNLNETITKDPAVLYKMYFEDVLGLILQCSIPSSLESFDFSLCKFEGSELYSLLNEYVSKANVFITDYHNDQLGHYAIEYYARKHNKINLNAIKQYIEWFNYVNEELSYFERNIKTVMKRYYTNKSIEEYMDFRTYHAKKKWEEFMSLILFLIPKSLNRTIVDLSNEYSLQIIV